MTPNTYLFGKGFSFTQMIIAFMNYLREMSGFPVCKYPNQHGLPAHYQNTLIINDIHN